MDSKNREWLGLQFQWSPNMWAKKNYINLLHIQHLQTRGNYFVLTHKHLARWVSKHPVDGYLKKKS